MKNHICSNKADNKVQNKIFFL